MASAKGPAEFCPDGDASVVSTSWAAWVEEFESYADSKGLFNLTGDANKDMRAQRKALLLYHAGARVREIHNTLTATSRHAYDAFLRGLTAYFTVEPNETFQRHIFRKMIQQEGETVSQYCARLRKAASNGCNYNDVDKMLRDQIVEYCISDDLRRELMKEGNGLDLARTLQLAATHESVELRFKEMSSRPLLNRVSSGSGNHYCGSSDKADMDKTVSYKNRPSNNLKVCDSCGRGQGISEQCEKCGKDKSHSKCPALGKQCYKCNGYNHFRPMCKAKTKSLNYVSDDREGSTSSCEDRKCNQPQDSYYAFTIHTAPKVDKLERVNVAVGGVNIEAIIDTGADCNVLCRVDWEKLKQSNISVVKSEKCESVVFSYASKTPLRVIGHFWANVTVDENKTEGVLTEFKVIEGRSEPLLGIATCKELGIVKINRSQEAQVKAQPCLDEECQIVGEAAGVIAAGPNNSVSGAQYSWSLCRWTIVALWVAILIVFGGGILWSNLERKYEVMDTRCLFENKTCWISCPPVFDTTISVSDEYVFPGLLCTVGQPMLSFCVYLGYGQGDSMSSLEGLVLGVPKCSPVVFGVPMRSPVVFGVPMRTPGAFGVPMRSPFVFGVTECTPVGSNCGVPKCTPVDGEISVIMSTVVVSEFGVQQCPPPAHEVIISGVVEMSGATCTSLVQVLSEPHVRSVNFSGPIIIIDKGYDDCDHGTEHEACGLGCETMDNSGKQLSGTCVFGWAGWLLGIGEVGVACVYQWSTSVWY